MNRLLRPRIWPSFGASSGQLDLKGENLRLPVSRCRPSFHWLRKFRYDTLPIATASAGEYQMAGQGYDKEQTYGRGNTYGQLLRRFHPFSRRRDGGRASGRAQDCAHPVTKTPKSDSFSQHPAGMRKPVIWTKYPE